MKKFVKAFCCIQMISINQIVILQIFLVMLIGGKEENVYARVTETNAGVYVWTPL